MDKFNKDAFLTSACHKKTEIVDLPEIGQSITVTEMTAGDKDGYDLYMWRVSELTKKVGDRVNDLPTTSEIKIRRLAPCLVDDKNKQLFTLQQLKGFSTHIIDKLVDVADRLNGLGADSIEDEIKN